jgi:predicted amidophosphoribosyltransferase
VTPLGVYQGAVREAVVATKRAAHGPLASSLGVRLGELIQRTDFAGQIDCVTFVPTHRWRRLIRGGPSGAQRMAISVGKVLNVPTIQWLTTTRWVAKQSLLPDEKRELNVRGAFRIKRSYAWQRSSILRDQHILLVDDVLTTGATAKESTSVLLQAGAASVRLAVLARAVRR